MKSFFQKTFSIVIASITIIVLGAWGYFLYVVRANQNEIVALSQTIVNEKDKSGRLASVRALAINIEEDIKKLDDVFIASDDVASFVELLETEADASNVSISIGSINVDDKVKSSVQPLVVRIEAEGSWGSILSYVTRLEHLPKTIQINKVILTKAEARESKARVWRLQADVTTHVVKK